MIRKLYKFKKLGIGFAKSCFPNSNKYINLGSGDTRFLGWTNLDYSKGQKDIPSFYIDIDFDLTSGKPLPFPDNSVSCVFCSHVFEHLDKKTVLHMCNEVYRILRNYGIFRIIVPNPSFENAEQIIKDYSHKSNSMHTSRWEIDYLRKLLFDVGFHFVYDVKPLESSVKRMKGKRFSSRSYLSNIIECDKRDKYINYTIK